MRARLLTSAWISVLVVALLAQATAFQADAAPPGNTYFERTWARTDEPVASSASARTWMWGPEAFTPPGLERYTESPNALRAAEATEWPGNVRELAHAVEAAVIRAAGEHATQVERNHLFPDGGPHASSERPGDVRGACLVSGLFDLRQLPSTHVNEWLRLDGPRAEANSPALRVAKVRTDLIVAIAEHDTSAFRDQSRAYLEMWSKAGNRGRLVDVRGANHYSIVDDLLDPKTLLARAVASQMRLP